MNSWGHFLSRHWDKGGGIVSCELGALTPDLVHGMNGLKYPQWSYSIAIKGVCD